jgi:nuclear transport factor 2 (NTF2) superfamily protein
LDTHAAVRAWIEAWEEAWPAKDAERIASRYRPDAAYRSHPFRDVTTAWSYVTQAFGEEDLVRCWFGQPIVEGDRAAVDYWAILRSRDGVEITIAGSAHLRFDEEGLVVGHSDYWDQRNDAVEPPAGWSS